MAGTTHRDEILSNEYVISKERILYVDPTEFASCNYKYNGRRVNNVTWNEEDLHMDVDLQVIIPSNDDCGTISYHIQSDQWVKDLNLEKFSNWVSFMQGNLQNLNETQNYLTTDYTNISFTQIKDNKIISKEDLGITSIDINFDAHFYPQVVIKFIDV